MKLIVGLGNPEDQENYANTRHNMGFKVLNKLSKKYEIDISRTKFRGLYGTGVIEGEKVILLKPQTFMNVSGESVIEFVNFYKIPLEDIILVYDDVDILPGHIRVRKSGSPGSHNGMKSVTHYLNDQNFARVRVGIGKPEYHDDMINYVIGEVPEEEMKVLEEGVDLAEEAIEVILKESIDSAMNKYNAQDIKVVDEEEQEQKLEEESE